MNPLNNLADALNSSCDSNYMDDEINPRTQGFSRKLFPPNTTLFRALGMVKLKLKNANRHANINRRKYINASAERDELIEANSHFKEIIREQQEEISLRSFQIQRILVEYDKVREEKVDLEQKLRQKRSSIRELNDRCETYALKFQQAQAREGENEAAMNALTSEIEKLREANKQAEIDLAQSHSQLATVTEKLATTQEIIEKNMPTINFIHHIENFDSSETEEADFETYKTMLMQCCSPSSLEIESFIQEKLNLILKLAHSLTRDCARKRTDALMKAENAEEQARLSREMCMKFKADNIKLKSQIQELEERAKQDKDFYKSISHRDDMNQKRLKAYTFAETLEFEELARKFDESVCNVFQNTMELLTEMNKTYRLFERSSEGPVEVHIKSISKHAFPIKLESGRDILEPRYLNQQIEKMFKLKHTIEQFSQFVSYQNKLKELS